MGKSYGGSQRCLPLQTAGVSEAFFVGRDSECWEWDIECVGRVRRDLVRATRVGDLIGATLWDKWAFETWQQNIRNFRLRWAHIGNGDLYGTLVKYVRNRHFKLAVGGMCSLFNALQHSLFWCFTKCSQESNNHLELHQNTRRSIST